MTSVTVDPPTEATQVAPVLVRGLTKAFGRVLAVRDLDIDVVPGEIVGFLGPNGAGKTTVLRVLTGALRATSGRVSVLGYDPFTGAARAHRELGYLPGDLRLPGHLTGARVLDLCAALRPTGTPLRTRLVEELDLDLSVPVHALSKGNRQKIGIVQALMSQPRLLLLDEPTSGLDPLAQLTVERFVKQAAYDGAAVLLSSHVLREVEQVADRVVMLRRGRLVASTRLDVLRASAPHEVRVRLEDPAAPARLSQVHGVHDLRVEGDQVTFLVPSLSLVSLLVALSTEQVRDLTVAPADLETLFAHLYQGEGRERTAAPAAP